MKKLIKSIAFSAALMTAGFATATFSEKSLAEDTHRIGAAKLVVEDLAKTQAFYETYFGSSESKHYDYDLATFEESIQSFVKGQPSIALFAPNPNAEKPLPKSRYPQVVIYTSRFDEIVGKLENDKHPVLKLPQASSGGMKIAITTDPSGNRVELIASDVAGERMGVSKLIVDDRAKAEAFYQKIFDATSGTRYQTKTYDEVIMGFGEGPALALFQPLDEAPLTKSRFALVAIYTNDFDGVVKRLDNEGLGYRKIKTTTPGLQIVIAQDPAGNAIEIIKSN